MNQYTEELLKELQTMIEELGATESRQEKENIILRHQLKSKGSPSIRDLLKYTYDPFIRFNISSKKIVESPYIEGYKCDNLIELLEGIRTGDIKRGDISLSACIWFAVSYPEYEQTFYKIIDKDLSCGIGAATINKVFPGLIPEFKKKVPLAEKYAVGLCDFENDVWYASRKMDGIRCLAFIHENGDIQFFSRNGLEFTTLDNLKIDLERYWDGPKGIILDGELCSIVDGCESFSAITKEYRKKNHTIAKPILKVFDIYPIDHFLNKDSYEKEFQYTIEEAQVHLEHTRRAQWLSQTRILSTMHFLDLCANVPDEWEGFMVRKNDATLFKRSKNLLKVKKFQDAEYVVTGIERGKKVIEGQEVNVCAALKIEHKGEQVKVGSGLSDRQRIMWYNNPKLIVGKTITVKYFSESTDQNGKLSLRFPVLKHVWEDKKE